MGVFVRFVLRYEMPQTNSTRILERKQSKDKQAREEREAETMELGEAEDAKTKKVVLQIR